MSVGGQRIGLTAAGKAAVGVTLEEGRVVVDCLVGHCVVYAGGEQQELEAPAEMEIADTSAGSPQTVPTEAIRAWNALCRGCVPSP